jgi:hypothetical protein
VKFVIITRIPPKQALLGVTPERWTLEETEAESLDAVKESLHVPLGGECKVVKLEDIVTIKPRIIYEEV